MSKAEFIKDWFDDWWDIVVDLHIAINNSRRLLLENKYHGETYLKNKGFFQHYIYSLKFIMIIQLSKLFDDRDNQKRSFFKLINRIENKEFNSAIAKANS